MKNEGNVGRFDLLVTLLLLVALIATTSYALFTNSFEGVKTSSIDTNDLKFNYNETSDSIILTDATSYTDSEGLTNGGTFTFDVSASSTKEQNVYYSIYLTEEATNTMDSSYIKLALLDNSNNTLVGTTSYKNLKTFTKKENAKFLYRNKINLTSENDLKQNYVLKYWVDSKIEELSTTTEGNKQTVSLNGGEFKFRVNVIRTAETAAEALIKKVGTGGLVAETHAATSQLAATTDYRFIGTTPTNYVNFNGELWRIIGVFDVDDGKGNLEQRIKLIRNDSIGKIAWDSSGVNNWSNATSMKILNSGDYWNRTGTYSSTGLTEEAKSMIDDAKWYLGGAKDWTSASNGLVTHFYSYERGTAVYSGNPTSWVGKIGLMYPSDYGYATSGGVTTTREQCLAKELRTWNELSDCPNSDWLFTSTSGAQWMLNANSGSSQLVFNINSVGYEGCGYVDRAFGFRPTIYLSSDILLSGGSGSSGDPYTLSK